MIRYAAELVLVIWLVACVVYRGLARLAADPAALAAAAAEVTARDDTGELA